MVVDGHDQNIRPINQAMVKLYCHVLGHSQCPPRPPEK